MQPITPMDCTPEHQPKLQPFDGSLITEPPVRAIIGGKKKIEEPTEIPIDKNYKPLFIKKVGTVVKIVEGKSLVQGGYGVINNGTILYSQDKEFLGQVDDIFGQITDPFYIFDGTTDIGQDVYVEDVQKNFVNVDEVSRKGTDREEGDGEPPEFSDDEEEREWKAKNKLLRQEQAKSKSTVEMPMMEDNYFD
ncbi:NAF1 domain containing protein [Entamoeba histolytica HM-1:IMSS-B]|uniref:H/ACA ribonucleoprotein complex subunit n=8 Tax=Entamoeba TaxID=5758 RepID=C4LVR4_ENTH1|nr:NAF1 domain containing protein [Entamoeba nuttalli P19]XP_656424.1 hypothetical protein, conserved [Entamoeba histolytica HM-1:IMSS]EMD49363.1 NAF1 domain containing protein [Entamoeba histolytica KU27]EMH77506.1 NAF1 domain containing protein [Entamoeba histolytica HM-1:IMSS-B]EMS12026.1 NAF1 domain containing protein [Entamoeba histolytica HM-3:IMSS]ENY64267.1 NAF1 domain containing protein [Entamoeba histolytica HM-1:IMSS-A]GAT92769.1 hypothetical protein conserved [Entamoeba histolytic|eukprot:XP_008859945.1 NAF1 domain containing protein [Entamoeba nuttalli P19]